MLVIYTTYIGYYIEFFFGIFFIYKNLHIEPFNYTIKIFCFDFSKNDNTFERNEDCATVFNERTLQRIIFLEIFLYIKTCILNHSIIL